MTQYLPLISAIIVAILGVWGNYAVGRLKNTVDVKSIAITASDALRDDLLNLVDKYEKREQFLLNQLEKNSQQNIALQDTVSRLREEITTLRIENQDLKAELKKTQADLEAFTNKVYYIPKKDSGVS